MEKILKKRAVRGILALFCCALWGSGYPCVKIGYEMMKINSLGSELLFAGYRFFFAGILTFVVGCFMEKRWLILKKNAVIDVFWLGMVETAITYLAMYVSMGYIEGAKGSVINASNVFVSILAAHFLVKGEKLNTRKLLGCMVGFIGVIVVNLEPGGFNSEFSLMGECMMFLSAFAYGMSVCITKRIAHKASVMTMTAYQMTFGGAVLLIAGWAAGGTMGAMTVKSVILYLYMIAFSVASFSIWTLLLKYNEVDKVSIFGFATPIFGVGMSGIFLGEHIISFKNFIALLLVSFGIICVNGAAHKMEDVSCKMAIDNVK